jgi:methionyl-tRNA formyltransferase
VRVLFWGTPEFATPSLRALTGEGFDVVAVVTQPDRPRGRSRSELVAPPVKDVAVAEDIPVLQPERPRGDHFIAELRKLQPDISVVVAYGHILEQQVIDLPRLGTINVHASLLPALRGAAPVHAAIRLGLAETGITIMQMVQALDAGPIMLQTKTAIAEDETYGELALRLSELGALALVEALELIAFGATEPQPQDDALATYAPKLDREVARVDWSAPAVEVARVVRAYDPTPAAFTTNRDAELKLFGARLIPDLSGPAGRVLELGDRMTVACGESAVQISEVQPSGRRRVSVADWARGRALSIGDTLGA